MSHNNFGHPARQLLQQKSAQRNEEEGESVASLAVFGFLSFATIFGSLYAYQSYGSNSGNADSKAVTSTINPVKDFANTFDEIDRRCVKDHALLMSQIKPNTDKNANFEAEVLAMRGQSFVISQPGPRGVQMGLKDAPGYLACAMATNPERLCNKTFRTALVKQISDYQRLRQYYASMVGSGAGMQVSNMMSRMDDLNSPKPRGRSGIIAGGRDSMKDVSLGILDGIKRLSSQGYLAKSDFGFFGGAVLSDIEASFVPVTQNKCS